MRLLRTPYFSMNLIAAFLVAGFASTAQASPREILNLITMSTDGHCDELVKTINERAVDGNADVLMYAGNIHEYGTCVNPDWEKATSFYQKAAKAGAPSAVARLIALYAVNLNDPAAALWWAAQRPQMLPKDCIPAADPVRNAAAFLEELRTWPAIQLNACTYHAGVMSRLLSKTMEWKVPGMSDTVIIEAELNLQKGAVDWFYANEKNVAISSTADSIDKPDLSSQRDGDSFLPRVWTDGFFAMREFGKPPSSDPRWTKRNTFTVEQHLRASGVPIQIGVSQ